MFTRMQHALTIYARRHVHLIAEMYDELEAWCNIISSLDRRPTHLRKLRPFNSDWMGMTDASGSGMGEFYQDTEGQYFVCCFPFHPENQSCLVSSSNPKGDATINDFELGALLMQLMLFAPRMTPLVYIHIYIDKTSAQGWASQGRVRTASAVGSILIEIDLEERRQNIHTSVGHMP